MSTARAQSPRRKGYIDWLRGIAVLIMIQGHVVDSWTLVADREREGFGWIALVGGLPAPMFLFLAGVALALASGNRISRGYSASDAAAIARKRGWQVFGLAFLFRLQSWVISGGELELSLLKVDILNIMGLSMLGAALLWGTARGGWSRAAVLAGGAIAVAMLTPIVRAADSLAVLPDPIERYFRPAVGRTTFTLFPWSGFVLAGATIGVWLSEARSERQERILNIALVPIGTAIALGAYAASFLPAIYQQTGFWTSSPTFFFVRLGILLSLLPLAYVWNRRGGESSPLREYGRSSLFIYWVHVELVYGVISLPMHRALTLEQAMVAFVLLSVLFLAVVKVKKRYSSWWTQYKQEPESAKPSIAAASLTPGPEASPAE